MNKSLEVRLRLRRPTARDSKAVWQLIQNCKPLDSNSSYAYLLLCTHFAETCVVAEQDRDIVGFVSGYLEPDSPNTLFIWQVAVDSRARGMGLGRRMLMEILLRPRCRDVNRLETTVSPSNDASRRMFQGVARRINTTLNEEPYIGANLLAEEGHEDENLVTIGPIETSSTMEEN